MIRLVYLYFSLIILVIAGCKTSSFIENPKPGKIPEAYAWEDDSSNSATVNWKEYFSDSTLISLINTVLHNNLDLLMALQRVEASQTEVLFSKGLLFPIVDVFGSAGQMRLGEYSADWAGNEGSQYTTDDPMTQKIPDYYVGFQSSWEIDIWGKLRNKKKAAVARYVASAEGKNWVITNLIAEIANAYYEVLALDNELQIIRETIKLQENALSAVKAQKEAGAANELAVKQFEAQLLNSQGLEKEMLQAITETESKINFLLGRFPQPIEREPASFNDSISIQIHTGIPSELLQNRPDIRQAEYELVASKADVKSAKAAFYPSLNITGALGFNAFNPSYLFLSPQSLAYNLFGSLAAPLINRSAIKADFKMANAYQLEALYNYQKTILNGYVEVNNELSNIKNLEQMYNLKAQEVDILTQSIDISSDLFRTGRATYLEVLLTQQNALQAKLGLINTRKRQYYSITNIYKALGGGWR